MSTQGQSHINNPERIIPPLDIVNRLMFITHATAAYDECQEARMLLQGGCRWIQLRKKEGIDLALAQHVVKICREECSDPVRIYLDDDVRCALLSGASGVHLGKKDMPLPEAWAIVDEQREAGRAFHIGATANTFEDIVQASGSGASYIGLGPYRFTETKKNLSPVLGLEGYRAIVAKCREAGIRQPIFAIGGIEPEDVKPILRTGIDGIAVSGSILQAADPVEMTQRFMQEIRAHFEQETSQLK